MKRKILFLLFVALVIAILLFAEITKFWGAIIFLLGLLSGVLISKIVTKKKDERHFYTPERDIRLKK